MKIYETASARRSDQLAARKIVSELVRSDVKPEQVVYRGEDVEYTLRDLLPGRYRLTALAAIDEEGRKKSLANQDSERFQLHAGERITAVIVLKKAPMGAILGVSAGVAGVVLLLAILTAIALGSFHDQEPVLGRLEPTPRPVPPVPPLAR